MLSLPKSECLTQPTQMQLSPKPKIFAQFFSELVKSLSNFEHFQKEDEPHS